MDKTSHTNPIVDIDHIYVSLNNKTILQSVSLKCFPGEWIVVLGNNGSGKSTLLRSINGLCIPHNGYIRVMNTYIPGRTRSQARRVWRQTGTVFQDFPLFTTKTVRQNVSLAYGGCTLNRKNIWNEVDYWLTQLGVSEKSENYPSELSGGERQRVALARAFLNSPSLLLLDEPFSSIDSSKTFEILNIIQKCVNEGVSIIMSTHRIELVENFYNKLIVLKDGIVEYTQSK